LFVGAALSGWQPNRKIPVSLTQEEQVSYAVTALLNGDVSVRLPAGQGGANEEIARKFNAMMEMLNSFADEVMRVSHETGAEGKLGAQAEVLNAMGKWKEITDSVNLNAYYVTHQVRN